MLFKNITVIDENYAEQPNMNLLVKGDTIQSITKEIPQGYSGEVYDGTNKVAMPGFFNLHCHLPMTLLRGYGEGLPLHRWLNEKMFPFEELMTAGDMYWGAMLGIAELMASGAVSVSDMYMEVEAIVRAVEESGFKANISRAVAGPSPDTRFADTQAYQGAQFLAQYNRNETDGRVIGDAGIHAEYTVHEGLVREVAAFAAENHMRMHIHLSETQKEHEECKERHNGMTPTQWFESLGVFGTPTIAAHCVYVEPSDMELLAKHGVAAAHCPSSNLKLGSGIAPIKAMQNAGMRIGIGTDGAASNNNLNMLEEVNLAAMVQKGANRDPLFLGTAEMLALACKNGALAQGRENCGCLKPGNKADVVIYNLDAPHMQPVYDTLANILYSSQASDIVLSMIDGEVVYKNGAFTHIDIEQAIWHAKRIAAEKLKLLGG